MTRTPRPHPLNQSFQWEHPSPPYRCIDPAQARQWSEQGFFLLEDAFDPNTLERVITEIDPFEAKGTEALRRAGGKVFIARADEITFTVHLVARSRLLRDFCSGPVFQDLVHDLIGPDVRLYWDQAVYKKPGTVDEFPWHQDNGYTYVEPQQYLTCWVALTDVDEQNGCPWVVPGLHRGGTLEHWTTELGFQCVESPANAVPVPARAGSIVVFSSLTPHRTGPNSTDGVRKAYIVQFAPDGARVVQNRATGEQIDQPCDAPERQFLVLEGGREPAAS